MIEGLLIICFFTPLAAGLLVAPFEAIWAKSSRIILVASTLIILISSLLLIPKVTLTGEVLVHSILPMSIKPASVGILVSIALVGFLSSLYNFKADEGGRLPPPVYSGFILLLLTVMLGLVLFHDLIVLFILVETTIGVTVILVTHKHGKFPLQAAFKYLIITAISAILFLAGIIILFNLTGDYSLFTLYEKPEVLQANPNLTLLAVALITAGLGADIGVVPFHGWLPDAVPASPDTVNSYVSVEGVPLFYALYQLVNPIFQAYPSPYIIGLLTGVGAASILTGNLIAYRQTDYMRMFAYSCIEVYGHAALILGLLNPVAYTAGFFYLINTSIVKMSLFQNLGVVEKTAKTTNMNNLGGLAGRLKKISYIYLLAVLSLTGIPPFAGFYAKILIYDAVYSFIAASNIILGILALTALISLSLIALAYFVNSYHKIFLGSIQQTSLSNGERHLLLWIPALAGVLVSLIIGIQPQLLTILLT
ncbi:MAG: complex I subunit 5 family protein [Nitrososphaerota archaeon]